MLCIKLKMYHFNLYFRLDDTSFLYYFNLKDYNYSFISFSILEISFFSTNL